MSTAHLTSSARSRAVSTVKKNQRVLYEMCRTLPWEEATAMFYDRTAGHARKETRVVKALTATGLRPWLPPCRPGRKDHASSHRGQERQTHP